MRHEKQITVDKKKVKVVTERHEDHPHKFSVSATIGTTTVNRRVTVGAANGPVVDYSEDQFLADIEKVRQDAAKHAAFREKVKGFKLE